MPDGALESSVSNVPGQMTGEASYTIPNTIPSCGAKHKFLGWATTADAEEAMYTSGNSITLNANTTLYAVWKQLTSIGGGAGTDEGIDG